jgi:hypothetical protein
MTSLTGFLALLGVNDSPNYESYQVRIGDREVEVLAPLGAAWASSARTLVPTISRMTAWWTRRSIAAAVVMGSLKIRGQPTRRAASGFGRNTRVLQPG